MTQFALFALFAKEGKTREVVVMTSGAFGEKNEFPPCKSEMALPGVRFVKSLWKVLNEKIYQVQMHPLSIIDSTLSRSLLEVFINKLKMTKMTAFAYLHPLPVLDTEIAICQDFGCSDC